MDFVQYPNLDQTTLHKKHSYKIAAKHIKSICLNAISTNVGYKYQSTKIDYLKYNFNIIKKT